MDKKTTGIIVLVVFGIFLAMLLIKPNQNAFILSSCGNQICEKKYPFVENMQTCPQDCHIKNKICEPEYGETCSNSIDCACGVNQTCQNDQCVQISNEENSQTKLTCPVPINLIHNVDPCVQFWGLIIIIGLIILIMFLGGK